MGFLFGDVLAITHSDLAVIWAGGLVVLTVLALIWRSLFAATVSRELAMAESRKPEQVNFIFMILMASVIAVAMKIVGVLLITAMLIIPAASAQRSPPVYLTRTDGGLCHDHRRGGCLVWVARVSGIDTPAGPSIVVAVNALCCFILSVSASSEKRSAAKTGAGLSCRVSDRGKCRARPDRRRSQPYRFRQVFDPLGSIDEILTKRGWLSFMTSAPRTGPC